MNSRESFESCCAQHAEDAGYEGYERIARDGSGYVDSHTQAAWWGWQAAQPQWRPISSAPKDGTEVLAWREDCGIFIASYTSLDSFPMSQSEIDEIDDETLFSKDWFTQWPQALRLEGSEAPTRWQPLPEPPKELKK